MRYDLIGDVHGYADELRRLLDTLGYVERAGTYRHADRTAVFLGDFIDRGPNIPQVLSIARSMVEAGTALAVMGNHELNALAFHTPNPYAPGEYLRPHTAGNIRQHAGTVAQLSEGDLDSHLGWFRHLPLWLDLDGLRVVHACWDEASLAFLGSPTLASTNGFIAAACGEGGRLFTATETLLKGKEAALPAGVFQVDHEGHPRSHIRLRWYADAHGHTYGSYGLINGDLACDTPLDLSIVDAATPYPAWAPPVFVGHYGLRRESAGLLATNVACVDWGVAHGGTLCAYRWDGEQHLQPSKFVSVARVN
jgi:hypothetical protein